MQLSVQYRLSEMHGRGRRAFSSHVISSVGSYPRVVKKKNPEKKDEKEVTLTWTEVRPYGAWGCVFGIGKRIQDVGPGEAVIRGLYVREMRVRGGEEEGFDATYDVDCVAACDIKVRRRYCPRIRHEWRWANEEVEVGYDVPVSALVTEIRMPGDNPLQWEEVRWKYVAEGVCVRDADFPSDSDPSYGEVVEMAEERAGEREGWFEFEVV